MPLPVEVNTVRVRDSIEFDRAGQPVTVQHWTYFIADQGPFTRKFHAGEQRPDHIERVISEHVEQLRALGVIPSPSS